MEDWIIGIIEEHCGTSVKRPSELADAINAKLRTTFKPIEALVEEGRWSSHGPGERLVSYAVAGYSEKFKQHYLYEVGAEVNAQGNGLVYVSRPNHLEEFPDLFCLGEDEFWLRAHRGIEPQKSWLFEAAPRIIEDTVRALPDIPKSLQKCAAIVIGFIKVEAKFNPDRVGTTVNVALIDRAARKPYAAVI